MDAAIVKPDSREIDMRAALRDRIKTAWHDNDYKTLDELGADYADHLSKTYSGQLLLSVFMSGLTSELTIEWPDEWDLAGQSQCGCKSTDPSHYAEGDRRWAEVDGKLKAWAKRYPKSIIAPLARVQYAINRAWFYRGSKYADKVNDKAWPPFHHYVEEADKALQSNASIRNRNPAWYNKAAELSAIADWPKAQRERLYTDMVEHGRLYAPAFWNAAQFLQPKWGGDYAAIEELLKRAMQHAPEKDGLEFYARVYWKFLESFDDSVEAPQEIAADWNTFKQGLNIMVERYPELINIHGAAMMACKYRDREYFDSMMRRMGKGDSYQGFPTELLDCSNPDFMPNRFIPPPPAR
ncbi:MAG TPA: hypothetical protein VIF60_19185 [Burkholderiaceae bacterium]